LWEIGACAVFFSKFNNAVKFKGNDSTPEVNQGTCQDAISSDCINALTKRATDLDVNGLGSSDACAKLEKSFNENFDDACKGYSSKDGGWEGISVKGSRSMFY
jgi:hypothetical protein